MDFDRNEEYGFFRALSMFFVSFQRFYAKTNTITINSIIIQTSPLRWKISRIMSI